MYRQFRRLPAIVLAGALVIAVAAQPAAAATQKHVGDTHVAPVATEPGSIQTAPSAPGKVIATGNGWTLVADGSSTGTSQALLTHSSAVISPMLVTNCGTATCSVYLSRASTKKAYTNIYAFGGGIAGLAAACGFISLLGGPAAPIIAISCGVSIAVEGGFLLNAISRANGDNGCLRIRYGALPTAYYDDHSSYCHNT